MSITSLSRSTVDFTTLGTQPVHFTIPIPKDAGSARLLVDAELDVARGADCIIRCSITQREETDQGKSISALLANPDSPAFQAWKEGVLQFARLLPQVSQREPAPSDRDPIPNPFDATYNNPQRNAFHIRIKYARDDQFLVERMLDAATRHRLDQAWIDLRTSFGYHDAWLRMLSEVFEFALGDRRMKDLNRQWFEQLPDEARGYLVPLHLEYQADRRALHDPMPTEPRAVKQAVDVGPLAAEGLAIGCEGHDPTGDGHRGAFVDPRESPLRGVDQQGHVEIVQLVTLVVLFLCSH